MNDELSFAEIKKEWHGTVQSYLIGFSLSLFLTLASFYLVFARSLSKQTLILSITGLALAQAICQLVFFLHLGQENPPRWETGVFLFMLLILLIIVIGSLWIMFDLNARMMPHG
ncbi:MAG: cytochrome o ubiquinol oxidase subunit IV [Parachlamydia sp.]|jgi:cytochrome o ubiquinol oxidase operon protein cyoD|nr:cytochrome o ubiquinol oxidase subunit IV [Parachlamydia sp.]